jgi:hypothetical protein
MCQPGAPCGCTGRGASGTGVAVALLVATAVLVSAASMLTTLLLAAALMALGVAATVTVFGVARAVRLTRPARAGGTGPARLALIRRPPAHPAASPVLTSPVLTSPVPARPALTARPVPAIPVPRRPALGPAQRRPGDRDEVPAVPGRAPGRPAVIRVEVQYPGSRGGGSLPPDPACSGPGTRRPAGR